MSEDNYSKQIFDDAIKRMLKDGENHSIYQLKLSNGEDLLAVDAPESDKWVNPLKINYIRNAQGTFNVLLSSWFITSEQYFTAKIDPSHVVSKKLVGYGISQYYRTVNQFNVDKDIDTLDDEEDDFGGIVDYDDLMPPEDLKQDLTEYQSKDIHKTVTEAVVEGRFVNPQSNGIIKIH